MFWAFPQLNKKNLSIWKVKLFIFCHVCLFIVPVENLHRALPKLHQKMAEVQDLSRRAPPVDNMTETIWRIKDMIEETRNDVIRVRSIFHWSVCKRKSLFLISRGLIDNFTKKTNKQKTLSPWPSAWFSHSCLWSPPSTARATWSFTLLETWKTWEPSRPWICSSAGNTACGGDGGTNAATAAPSSSTWGAGMWVRPPRRSWRRGGSGLLWNAANKCFNLQASGDYIGMALRNNVLLCSYKLSGTVHQVETSQLTISSGDASSLNRVIFRRYERRRQSHSLQLWLKLTLAPVCALTVQSLPRRWSECHTELHIREAPEATSQTQPPQHHQQPPQAGCRQPGFLRGRLPKKLYGKQL